MLEPKGLRKRDRSPQDDSMTAQSGEGSGDLKRPHDMATPDNDTPSKKTLSEAPATPASDSSAIRTERARLMALLQKNQVKSAVATTRQAEAVKIMQDFNFSDRKTKTFVEN